MLKTNSRGGPSGPGGTDSDSGIWVTEFDDGALKSFYEKFMELEKDPTVSIIPVYIASYGGQADILFAMRDIIRSSPKLVATIALGKAMSCGVALLAAGTKGLRFCGPNTDIMIHTVSAGTFGKVDEMKAALGDIERTNHRFLSCLAKDTGHTLKQVTDEITRRKNADWFLSAEEAMAYGIVDHIEIPRTAIDPPSIALVVLPKAPLKIETDKPQAEPQPKKRGKKT